MKSILQKWGLLALTLFTFFILLGGRSLNEPDEGRYSEIAREMNETGDWLVPHLWYLPHLDKPPMTYWFVAASMKVFGQNEWAARLPVALAGVSGVWAAFLLGCSLGGQRVGLWSAVILQSSLLYFVMARMLTPDILLTQFIAWAMYFFWRSWQALESEVRSQKSEFFRCHLVGWIFIALGFLTKGPIALAIPLVAFAALALFRRRENSAKILLAGFFAGFFLFLVLAAPWFLAVFRRVPESAHYMVFGQAAGHLLGTTIKNRPGGIFYFFGILAVGFLPWIWLLGWLWRSPSPQSPISSPKSEIQPASGDRQSAISKHGWLLLNVWAIFTFVLFSLAHAKLPAYILPIFPALAVMVAWKFFGEGRRDEPVPAVMKRIFLGGSLLLPAVYPVILFGAFQIALPIWLKCQLPVAIGIVFLILRATRKWKWPACATLAVGLTLASLIVTVAEIPQFETSFKRNQTFKPLGAALRENYRPGDAIVCWGLFPQGLPFYSSLVISRTNRPYLGGMELTQVPFEFPGNRDRLGGLLLPDDDALAQLLESGRRIWIIGPEGAVDNFKKTHDSYLLHRVAHVGRWELFVSR
jgi:4-amino-4-deoxy-L-arabinose transferase-like glycosyltransferase